MEERVTCGICRWVACVLRKPRSMRVARVVVKARVLWGACDRLDMCPVQRVRPAEARAVWPYNRRNRRTL